MRNRWCALLAATVLVLVAGLSTFVVAEVPVARRLAAAPVGGPTGSMSARPDASGPALVAVEVGRVPVLARSETSQPSWLLGAALVAVFLLLGSIGRRRPHVRGLLELAIRSQTQWWRPAPGGRAPPRPCGAL